MNVIKRLQHFAQSQPDAIAVAEPKGTGYETITFAELERCSDAIADRLVRGGVKPGMKLVLMTRPGIRFTANVFGIYKAGAVVVLIDPGMGIRQLIRCLTDARPDGFIGPTVVQLARWWYRKNFPNAKCNFPCALPFSPRTAGPGAPYTNNPNVAPLDDAAAIIFTSGSTGVAKGVLFTHTIFDHQVQEIAARYDIKPGDVDLACFPFFGLFNAAMGVTAVVPKMNSTKPAAVDPENILRAVRDWNIVQSFGSPALWNRVTEYCIKNEKRMETLRRVIIAGAPIMPSLLDSVRKSIHPAGEAYTPYGATEALPVASIGAGEVLGETVAITRQGGGICVGKKFGGIEWRVIPITDSPIERLEDVQALPLGEIGELAVTGPQVTQRYVTRVEANAFAKMLDAQGRIWHRMGDVGYLDASDRFFFCGRKSHRVVAKDGNTYFTDPCEAIYNNHPHIFRSALVGVDGKPVMIVQPKKEILLKISKSGRTARQLIDELMVLGKENPLTRAIERILIHPSFPVDVRHNAKINREQLAVWAATQGNQ